MQLRVVPRDGLPADQERHRVDRRAARDARRPRPGRPGRGAALRRRTRAAAGRRRRSGRCSPATSRCWCATNSQAQLVQAQPARGRRTGRADRQDVASSRRRRPRSGSCCSRRWSSRTAPTRVRRVALTCFVGLDAAELDARRRRLRRRPRAEAAGLGRGARGARGRRDVRGGVARPAAAAADPRPGRRRAAAHRPAAHRAGAARGGAGGAARPDRAAGLAAPAHASEAAGEGGQERSRRLETDAAAVQVITVHTSKGLEFPVVMVPFAWDNWGGREPADRGLPRRARPPGARRRRPGQPRLGRARARSTSRRRPTTSCG